MKKFVAFGACLFLFALVLTPRPVVYSQQSDNEGGVYAKDRIIVKFKAEAEPSDLDATAGEIVRVPGVRAETLTRRPGGSTHLIRLNGTVSVEQAVQRAKQDPRVEFAEPDYFVYASDTVPNDPLFSSMWGLSSPGCSQCAADQQTLSIDATRAWDITTGSDDIVVAVLDTGVDLKHEDLSANAWVNPSPGILGPSFVNDLNGWNFYDGTNQLFKSYSEDFHGTHVAGSIGALGNNGLGVAGVAWHVKLMSLKFLGGTQGKGSTSNAVLGINYAISMRNRGVNVRVINASWGGGSDSQALRQAIAAANEAGILFVAAAGNGSTNIDDNPDFPAAYARDLPNAISVAALDNTSGYLATFSNFGHASVSLAAPGTQIYSTLPNRNDTPGGTNYGQLQGTSMSTPYVSGIAVLLWAHEPSLTPAQVKQRIIDTSEPSAPLVSKLARSGRANAYDALTNRIPPVQRPSIVAVNFTKTAVIIDGFGFVDGSAMIEADGSPLPNVSYDSSFALANGTLTRLIADIGKKPLKRTFPYGATVSVDVINPTTGDRSANFNTARY
ncbi:MAG TPA: S8 family peptidase [Blastocatellia bacterium]|jgi:subtilisin family serine protease